MKKCGSAAGIFVRSLCVASSLLLALGMVLGLTVAAHAVSPGDIVTVAGNGAAGFSGDNGIATTAMLNNPHEVAITSDGSFYIADYQNHRIRKIAATGIITTVAGNGTAGFSGDNGPATSASLNRPTGVAVDRDGNIFISDSDNYRIRKVNALTGIITTVAGSTLGFSGDNGPATSAQLRSPFGMAFDGSGNLYFSDGNNNCIRMVNVTTGIITTVAGIGSVTGAFSGDNGLATSAALSHPRDIVFDNNGNIYIADYGNHRIRKVDAVTGIITTVAGNGTYDFSGDGGLAGSASFKDPYGLVFDSAGNLYVSDSINNRIRKIDAATGIITTVAGNGSSTFSGDNGPALSASLFTPWGMAIDSAGNLLIVDSQHNRIRKVYLNPVSTTVTTLTSSVPANASVYGTPVTFTVTVTSNDGIPGGTVTVMDGASPLGNVVLDESGQATFSTSFLSVGSHTITAVYGLAGIYNTSTSNGVVHNVNVPPVTPPTVSTDTVSAVTTTGVTLNGWAGSNGAISTISFDYGLTTAYGSSVSAGTVAAGSGSTSVNATVNGLSCNTTYHFRIKGQNSAGISTGLDSSFTTNSCAAPGVVSKLISAPNRIDMVYDDTRGVLYITSGNSILRYKLATSSFLTPYTFASGNLLGIDLSPDRTTLAVADSNITGIHLVDLQTDSIKPDILFTPAFGEGGTFTVAYGNDGYLLVSSRYNGSGWVPLRRVNPDTGEVTIITKDTINPNNVRQDTMLSSSADGTCIGYAESNSSDGPIGFYDVSTQGIAQYLQLPSGTGAFNYEIGTNRNCTQFAVPTYFGTYVYDNSLAKQRTIGVYAGGQPIGVVYHPRADIVYFAWVGTSELRAYDTTTFAQLASYDVGYTFQTNGNNAFNNGRLKTSRNGAMLFTTVGNGVTFTVIAPPIMSLDSAPLNYSNQASGTIEFSAGETATYQCSLDNAAYTACSSPFSYSGLANGQHTFAVKATDTAGNVSAPVTHTWTINNALAESSAILVPQTGQATCHDTSGAEIACEGTGQDGDNRAGILWPSPRFTNNDNGTITDNLTGLRWMANVNIMATKDPSFDTDDVPGNGAVTWRNALNYIARLNSESYLGFSDWRLPNVTELASVINRDPAGNTAWLASYGFTNLIHSYYWTSTTVPGMPTDAYDVYIEDGDVLTYLKTSTGGYVWPVRGSGTLLTTGQTGCYADDGSALSCTDEAAAGQDGAVRNGARWPEARFVDNGNSTFTDRNSGLIWLKDARIMASRDPQFDSDATAGDGDVTWRHALDYIKKLNQEAYLGYSDWRLPNANEFLSLADRQQADLANWLDAQIASATQGSTWWTATAFNPSAYEACFYGISDGVIGCGGSKWDAFSVWPVRGGYVAPRLTVTKSGVGTISASTGALTWDAGTTKGVASYEMGANTIVTLTAAPGAGLSAIWAGCDTFSSTTCTVTMSAKRDVSATFADVTAPAVPTNIETQVPTMTGQLATTWTKPGDADFSHIHIYRSTAAGTLGTLVGDGLTGIEFTDTGLASQTRYYYTVRSVDTTGNESSNTAQVSGTTLDATPPAAATGVTVSDAATGGKLNISWIRPTAADLASITLYRSTASGQLGTVAAASQTGTTYSDTGLTNGMRYYYIIRAFDTSGNYSDTAQYSAVPTAPVNGLCGSATTFNYTAAPAANLCTMGTPSSVSGNGPWSWTCSDLNGGTPVTCTAAQAGGVVYRSNDSGVNWTPTKTGLAFNSGLSSLLVSPLYATDHTLFIGSSDGIHKSSDSGDSWSQVVSAYSVRAFAVSPAYASDRTIFAGAILNGVYKSTNGGTSWVSANTGLANQQVRSLAISPSYASDRTVFVGLLGQGSYKSTDNGATWIAANTGLAGLTPLALAVSPAYASDRTLFAVTTDGVYGNGGPHYHVYRSIDSGTTWTLSDTGLSGSMTTLGISPNYAVDQTLYVVTSSGVYKSSNKGVSWVLSNSSGTGNSISLSPAYASDQTLFAGIYGDNIYRSNNGGSSWSASNSGLAAGRQISSVTVSPTFGSDHTVFAASSLVGPSASVTSSLSFGNVGIGNTSSNRQVFLANAFPADVSLSIAGISLSGAGADQFSISAGSCGSLTPVVAVGSQCSLNVVFSPTSTGNKSATIQITTNDAMLPIAYVSLSGSGIFIDTIPPSAPTNIEVQTPTVKGQMTITWTNPADADLAHIHIYRSTAAGTLGTLVGDGLTGIKFTDTGLASQTRYYYTVRSVDTTGNESSNTAQVSGTTLDATPPAAATGVTVSDAATGGKLNISWIRPTATDLASITLYRSTASGQLGTVAATNQTGISYSDTGLTNGTVYYYTVRATDTSGNYSDTAQSSGTPTAPDTTPPGVISCTGTITQPLPLTGDKLQLNWANPADSDYALTRVYASTDASLGTLVYQGTGTGYLHTGLTAGATYNYTYRTVDTAGNETSNTGYCSYTPVDQTAPACPTELNAVRNIDDTVTLSWNRSASPDIHSYQIFASAADAAVAYATPTATVISPTVTWTSGLLTQGKTYQFGIRTVDSLLTSPNVSGNCGVISVAIPNPAPACDVSASIKVPQTGKKLGGNRTSVIAEITSGSESSLASVRFQYRVSGIANSWLNVPSTDPVNFPNPDTVKPWFVHWDISGLTDNSDYDIRAVATCTNTAQDATPNYITVAVNKGDPDSDEDDNTDGEHRKTEKVGGEADSHIVKGDTDDTRVTTLTLPAQSVPEGVRVTVTESNPATKAALVPSDHGNVGTFREISFDDGRHLLDNSKKAELTVPYKDDNNDGIADGTAINVHDLQVCDYDSVGGRWNCLDSTVDTAAKTVKAKTATFSLFGLLAPPKPLVAGWNLVSVPLTPSPATAASVFGAGAFFYNPATGAYPAASTIEAGKAYWVRNGFTSIKATGTETPDSSFSIPIKRGWNLIGNPFRYKVNVSDLQIANGSTVAIAVAEANGWAVGTLFNYSNGSYQMSSHQDGGVLEPWKGYWILSDINGTLIVPNTPAH